MARLNEPAAAPSTENIEAVKRRFLRQNRELAKTNSTQSIRIRNLEAEGSRLLAENLSLREQVIQLQNALENQSGRPSAEAIDALKDRLEAKIQELGGIVAGLGDIQRPPSAPRCKSQLAATRRSPDERQWRSGLGLADVENAMLPTITEDKHYPRRTMNADELRDILDNPDSQSPDLGPPPVARFENVDPVKFDPTSAPDGDIVEPPAEEQEVALPVNLETRRKRRDSDVKLRIRRVAVFQSPPEGAEDGNVTSKQAIRAGAKRKMSALEDGEKQDSKGEPQMDGFRFSRKTSSEAIDNNQGTDGNIQDNITTERPALSSKPVNTDPVLSPKKQRGTLDKPDKPDLKRPVGAKASRNRNITPKPHMESIEPIPAPVQTAEISLDSLPPKTPFADDILSPPPTEPSTQRPESKDTPPPSNLNLANPSEQPAGGRGARRARAQVNYAEPNLISKMRRPTKELVDAVQSKDEHRTSTSVEMRDSIGPATIEKSKMRTVVIKREQGDGPDSAWKNLPSATATDEKDEVVGERDSPLGKKTGRQSQAQQDRTDEEELGLGSDVGPMRLNSSAASEAISALIAGSTTTKRKTATTDASSTAKLGSSSSQEKARSKDKPDNLSVKEPDNLAIFDFAESSPTDNSAVPPTTSRPKIDLAKQTRTARRHSTMTSTSTSNSLSSTKGGALPSVNSRQPNGFRSSSASNLAGTAKASDEVKARGKDTKRSALTSIGSESEDGKGSLRGERAANRRRSMML